MELIVLLIAVVLPIAMLAVFCLIVLCVTRCFEQKLRIPELVVESSKPGSEVPPGTAAMVPLRL